ncbi:tissue factor pathway inhibitor 2 [Suncus etruscus]|uniref:tissue factor pathway inhibitor 2 n=1 Tax=Suncus etruscus TaxID=109475 RepID=UPI00210F59C9|nr:tissue factor pathway inhibitor 2 [Suncus etruscus]
MDPVCPPGLLLLPLLLIGNGLIVATQRATGNNAEVCLLPMEDGPCRALIPKYFYERASQSCQMFYYGGCYGNANNFETLDECKDACWRIEKVPKICRMEIGPKKCGVSSEDYFFDLATMSCEKFSSGGCQSSGNSFPDRNSCEKFCLPKRAPSFCYTPKDEGVCAANVTRYYFNARYKECEAFRYTGCGGNNNNFVSMEDCERVCAKGILKEKDKKKPGRLRSRKVMRIRRKYFNQYIDERA